MNEENTPTATPSKESPASLAASVFDYVEMFVFAIVFVLLLMSLFFRLCEVDGPSMNNTLKHGEKLLVSDLFYTPKNGDVIVFHNTNEMRDPISSLERLNEPIVKRVIAVGGQYVMLDYTTKTVYVSDDDVFDESDIVKEDYAYFSDNVWRATSATAKYYVPEGHLFVMGDNRNNSADSRYTGIGMVDARRVLGKVVLRLTPISSFGKIS